MCICDDGNSVFQAKKLFVMQNLEANGAGVKIRRLKCHIWNCRPWFQCAMSLCNFLGLRWKL